MRLGFFLSFLAWAQGNKLEGLLRESDLPDTGEEWISLSEETEFLPSQSSSHPSLREAQRRLLAYTDNFVDGNTYYDEYSQAWRVLGWYIDCSPSQQDGRKRRRKLDGNAADDGGNNYYANENLSCMRYILWAAYVDLDYQGGGIGEYQFYNEDTEEWDVSTCKLSKSKRCALMDCHLPTTHFKLLGYFKQYDYDNFFEQLFKHEAYCIWTESEYEFMNTYREWWPEGCQNTGQTSGSKSIYMDIKPLRSGDMGLGLYVDPACTQAYTGRSVKLENLIDSYAGSSLDSHIESWNKALGVFKKCQPCKAYDLSYVSNGDNGGDDDNAGLFYCKDNAGYENVNQCMKFSSKTNMEKATYRDVQLAAREGTITRIYSYDASQSFLASWGLFVVSSFVFLLGLIFCIYSAKPKKRRKFYLNTPRTSTKKVNSEPLLSSARTLSTSASGRLSPNSMRLDSSVMT